MTLIEVCLVLAVLVVVGALAYPSLQGPFARQRVRKAAERVRVVLAKGRNMAMRSGRIMVFRYELNRGRFEIVPFARQQDFVEGDLAAATAGGRAGAVPAGAGATTALGATSGRVGELPERIVFAQVAVGTDARAQFELQSAGIGLPAAGNGIGNGAAPPIVLYPDGTTSDARILVSDAQGRGTLIVLRGLTGMTRVADWNPQTAAAATGGGTP